MLGSDRRSIIPNLTLTNPSRSEPNNFSFNSLLTFRSPIWTYNYLIRLLFSVAIYYGVTKHRTGPVYCIHGRKIDLPCVYRMLNITTGDETF